MADLPDYYTQIVSEEAEAWSFRGGADSAKPASPTAKQIWLATDTKKLYICVADGTWAGFDASILVQGILTLYENMDANNKKITSLAAPTANADGARKLDVDTVDAKLDDVSVDFASRSLSVDYQNGSKIRAIGAIVQSGQSTTSNYVSATAYSDANASPSSIVALGTSTHYHASLSMEATVYLFFIVKPNQYYRIDAVASGTPAILNGLWAEWDLH